MQLYCTVLVCRSQLKITLKVFLREYNVEALVAGVEAALANLNTDHVDTLFLPVPADAVPIIGPPTLLDNSNSEQKNVRERHKRLYSVHILFIV